MRIAILGCGPAALFAAHAAWFRFGYDVTLFSEQRRMSTMYGAQYLHAPINGLTPRIADFMIDYVVVGTAEEYARKVYGDAPPDFVSPATLAGQHEGWDIRFAYATAWRMYSGAIREVGILTGDRVRDMLAPGRVLAGFDRIISTIPAPALCVRPREHFFTKRYAWAIGDAPDRGQLCPIRPPLNRVICDGTEDRGYYRVSNVAGHCTAEWPEDRKPPIAGVARVTKVVDTNCDCWKESGFWRTGRYGAWDKSVFTHHAYWSILKAFTSERGEDNNA